MTRIVVLAIIFAGSSWVRAQSPKPASNIALETLAHEREVAAEALLASYDRRMLSGEALTPLFHELRADSIRKLTTSQLDAAADFDGQISAMKSGADLFAISLDRLFSALAQDVTRVHLYQSVFDKLLYESNLHDAKYKQVPVKRTIRNMTLASPAVINAAMLAATRAKSVSALTRRYMETHPVKDWAVALWVDAQNNEIESALRVAPNLLVQQQAIDEVRQRIGDMTAQLSRLPNNPISESAQDWAFWIASDIEWRLKAGRLRPESQTYPTDFAIRQSLLQNIEDANLALIQREQGGEDITLGWDLVRSRWLRRQFDTAMIAANNREVEMSAADAYLASAQAGLELAKVRHVDDAELGAAIWDYMIADAEFERNILYQSASN